MSDIVACGYKGRKEYKLLEDLFDIFSTTTASSPRFSKQIS